MALSHLLASEELFLLSPFLLFLLPPLLLPPLTLLLFLALRPEFSISPVLLELKYTWQVGGGGVNRVTMLPSNRCI